MTVNIPIFDGNDKRLRRRQYEYDRHRAMVEYEQKRKQMDKDYGDAMRRCATTSRFSTRNRRATGRLSASMR